VDNFDTVPETLYIVAMRIHSRRLLVGTLVLVPFLMLGCAAASDPQLTDSPVQTVPTPVFASNEEALAAATQAYGAYLSKAGEILASGGERPERITEFVTTDYLPALLTSFQKLADSGNKNAGIETIDTVSLVRYNDDATAQASVSIYLCADITNTRVLDATGADITPGDRTKRIPLQVALVSGAIDRTILLVAKEDVWSGQDFC